MLGGDVISQVSCVTLRWATIASQSLPSTINCSAACATGDKCKEPSVCTLMTYNNNLYSKSACLVIARNEH